MKYSYDPDANVLSVTLSEEPFDYAEEMGDFVVHFAKSKKPVYVEILNANKFLTGATTVLPSSVKKELCSALSA